MTSHDTGSTLTAKGMESQAYKLSEVLIFLAFLSINLRLINILNLKYESEKYF